ISEQIGEIFYYKRFIFLEKKGALFHLGGACRRIHCIKVRNGRMNLPERNTVVAVSEKRMSNLAHFDP
ncbi:hypothetical protein AAHH79_34015, partial [Burkholderia pseudomallei]